MLNVKWIEAKLYLCSRTCQKCVEVCVLVTGQINRSSRLGRPHALDWFMVGVVSIVKSRIQWYTTLRACWRLLSPGIWLLVVWQKSSDDSDEPAASIISVVTLKIEGIYSLETLLHIYQTSWSRIPEGSNLHVHWRENFKSHMSWFIQLCTV